MSQKVTMCHDLFTKVVTACWGRGVIDQLSDKLKITTMTGINYIRRFLVIVAEATAVKAEGNLVSEGS